MSIIGVLANKLLLQSDRVSKECKRRKKRVI